jgi:hypothetical protein
MLDTGHTCSTIDQTMEVLHIEKKGQEFNTWERFHICSLNKETLQMNDIFTDPHNPIFAFLIHYITPPPPPHTIHPNPSIHHITNISYTQHKIS